MSQRPPVDRARIESFLDALAGRFRHPGRVYLVGGTTMVFEGFREQTLDVDIAYEVDDQYHTEFIRTVRALKDQLGINVKEASPGDFIPLPPGYEERAEYIGRFGELEIFHFDLYSMALSKIERGRDADFADVLALLKAGRIDFDQLTNSFERILPSAGARSLKADPVEFQRKFEYLKKTWDTRKS